MSLRRVAAVVLVVVVLVAVGFGVRTLVDFGTTSENAAPSVPENGVCARALTPTTSDGSQAALAVVVGPAADTNLNAYVDARGRYLAHCSAALPDQRAVAIVSLSGSASPTATTALVGEVSILTAYVRLPSGNPLVVPVSKPLPVGTNQGPSLTDGYAALRDALRRDASANPAAAATDLERATALDQGCGCVYALAVAAPLRTLAALARNSAIRLVDAAPLGFELDRISARPLLPSETMFLDPTGAPSVFAR